MNGYNTGFDDALRWILDAFNLDMEDEQEIQRVLEGGHCEARNPERLEQTRPAATRHEPTP